MAFHVDAQAQVQRSFVNLGFEQPDMVNAGCVSQVSSAIVPGWETTHPSGTGFGCGAVTTIPATNVTGPLIELWSTPFNGVSARSGDQFAELNANVASRIYQNVCLVNGETVRWQFSHRGRNSATVDDVAEFNINSSANTVVRARTQNDGGTGYTTADCTVNDGSVTSGTCNSPVMSGTWRDYSGQFVWMGGNGVQSVGFEAISSAGGVVSVGNFIDDIQIILQPYVEFELGSFTIPEQGTPSVQLRVLGVVPAGGITVPITATGGTATAGSDFTLGTVNIPAGDYGTGQLFTVPLTIINDTVIENNETVVLLIGAGSGYVTASTNTCGAAAIASTTGTIVDNDVDLLTTKTASTAIPAVDTPFTYTITFRNNTAVTTVAPVAAHNVSAAVADAVPTGLSFGNWTCVASGGASCPGGTVNGTLSGSGAISGNALLPGGNAGAGGVVTYTLSATATGTPNCAAITNTSTIATPSGFEEGTSVQAGFTSPTPPGGTANNTATAVVDPICPSTLTLNKVTTGGSGGAFNFTLANTTQAAGAVTTSTAGTPVQVDGNAAAGIQPFTVMAAGTAVTITESSLPTGWTLNNATCQTGATTVGSLTGTTYTIPAASVVENSAFVCNFTNRLVTADLLITKTNATPFNPAAPNDVSGDTVTRGTTTSYTVVVTNNGPDAITGATVRDPAVTGLVCADPVPCTGSGCPAATVPLASLQGTGVVLGTLTNAGTVTFTMSCTVQ